MMRFIVKSNTLQTRFCLENSADYNAFYASKNGQKSVKMDFFIKNGED